MKNSKSILTGIFCPLYYFIVLNFMYYAPYPFSEILSGLQYFILLVPSIVLTRFLISNSLKDFWRKFAVCFLVSLVVVLAYLFSGIDWKIHYFITGYEELSVGHGFFFVVTFHIYIVSCAIGSIISAVVTWIKGKRNRNV